MLIDFKKGIIHSFDLKLFIKYLYYFNSFWVLGFQVKVQTSNSDYSVLKDIKDLVEIPRKYIDLYTNLLSSFSVCSCGMIFNSCVIWSVKLIITNDNIANGINNIICRISYPTFDYLSSVIFLLPNNNDRYQSISHSLKLSLKSLVHTIKNRPKPFITSLVYYISINQLFFNFILYTKKKMVDYYMDNYTDKSPSLSKAILLTALYLIFTNPILSAVTLSVMTTPFQNLSSQYFKLLTESQSNQYSFLRSNPIEVYRQLLHKKGIIKSLYSGVSLTFLMRMLK